MKFDTTVPFFSNTSDDTHCFQAALKMLIGYYFPGEEYSWNELDKITAKVKGLWTWPTAGLLWLQNKGLEIKIFEDFDYQRFVDEGEPYLIQRYGQEAGQEQINHSDVSQERRLMKDALKYLSIQKTIPTIENIKQLIQENYLLICLVNSKVLNHQPGYVGHFVVVKGFENDNLILHDPGLPPMENRVVSYAEFETAWASPNENVKSIIAFCI